MTDDLELRKQIAAEAQIDSAVAASPGVRAFQFFLVPLLIVAACVLVYAGVGLLMGKPKTAREWLQDIKEGGPNTRNHAALQLAQALRRGQGEPGLARELILVYRATRPDEHDLRRYLVNCMGNLGDPETCDLILEALRTEPSLDNRAACMDALGALKSPDTLPELVKLLDDGDPVVRKYAAFNAGSIAERAADRGPTAEALKKKLSDPRPDVGWNAAFALAYFLGDSSGTDTLKKMLDRKYLTEVIGNDPNADVLSARAMVHACTAAAKLKDRTFLPFLRQVADPDREPDMDVRMAAQKAVALIEK